MLKRRSSNSKAGFTLIELMVVVIIIGILASISTAFYTKTVDESQKKQAKAMLNLIRSAEEIYWGKERNYYPFGVLNNTVRDDLMISVYNNEDWQYSASVPAPGVKNATATATRERGSNEDRVITIDIDTGVISSY